VQVFLSYAQPDASWARQIAKGLRESGLHVWDPELEILPGDDLSAKLGQALRDSDAMVVLVSPEAVESRWVRYEIEQALSSSRFRDRLVPVIVRPTRNMPWILRELPHLRMGKQVDEVTQQIVSRLGKKSEAPTAASASAR
jgi:hypothetical protein